MALVPIFNQQIQMGEIPEKDYACETPTPFCTLFKKTDDPFRVQLKQTPCGDNLICNPDFDFGNEIITNGTFTGAATGWTLAAGWAYGSNKVTHSGGPGNSIISQNIPGLVVGQVYYITVTISGISDAIYFILGGTASGFFTDNGTFTFPLTAGGSGTLFEMSAVYDVSVDDVSMKTINCWSAGGDWLFAGGGATHTPGSSTDLKETIYSTVANGDYVEVGYQVFGMSAGSVVVKVGGTTVRTVTQNGTYTDYVSPAMSDNDLIFTPSSDFNGKIYVNDSYRLYSAAQLQAGAYVVDSDGAIINPAVITLNEDRVNMKYVNDALPDGCYRMQILDPCASLTNGAEISTDVPFDNSGVWSFEIYNPAGGASASVTGGKLVLTNGDVSGGPDHFDAIQSHVFPNGSTEYSVEIEVQTGVLNTAGAGQALSFLYPNSNGGAWNIATIESSASSNTTYTKSFIITVANGTSGVRHNKFALRYDNGPGLDAEVNNILSFSVKLAAITDADNILTSNCLKLMEDTGDALLMQGISDNSNSLGFKFDSNFPYLSGRLFLSFTNPHHPDNQGNYLGPIRKTKTFAQLETMYDLLFLDVDQNMHASIAAMLSTDDVRIGESLTSYRQYIWEEKSYEPKWAKKSPTGVAEAEIEIGRLSTTVFN